MYTSFMPISEDEKKTSVNLSMTITAFFTAVIAVTGLVYSLWQGYTTQKFYYLTVKPILGFAFVVTGEKQQAAYSLVLKNGGVGPAIIKKVNFYKIERTSKNQVKRYNSFPKLRDALDYLGFTQPWLHTTSLSETGTYIRKGGDIVIMYTTPEGHTDDRYEIFWNAMKQLDIEIQYQSIYKEETFNTTLKAWTSTFTHGQSESGLPNMPVPGEQRTSTFTHGQSESGLLNMPVPGEQPTSTVIPSQSESGSPNSPVPFRSQDLTKHRFKDGVN
jgi:hypothetical protein